MSWGSIEEADEVEWPSPRGAVCAEEELSTQQERQMAVTLMKKQRDEIARSLTRMRVQGTAAIKTDTICCMRSSWKLEDILTIADWKTSARRCPKGKADTDLQATCYLRAEHHQSRPATQFRFDVVTTTKEPACERHHAARGHDDFAYLGELVRVLRRIIANESFLPRKGSWECANCPYGEACKGRHIGGYRDDGRCAASQRSMSP